MADHSPFHGNWVNYKIGFEVKENIINGNIRIEKGALS
jgi:hypothetical protein